VLLVWNAGRTSAAAVPATRELKARELDIVSNPADSLLIYNGRTGQFIVGLTGRLRDGGKPSGAEGELLPVSKQSWRRWRNDHPETKVMLPSGGSSVPAFRQVALRTTASFSSGHRWPSATPTSRRLH
jgi:hypothetical protein